MTYVCARGGCERRQEPSTPLVRRIEAINGTTTAVDLARADLYADAGDVAGLRTFAETWWREPLPDAGPALLGRRMPYLIKAGMLEVAERDLQWFEQRTAKTTAWAPRVQMRQLGPFYISNKALIALKRGQRDAAVGVLREQMAVLRDGPTWLFGPAGSHTFFAATQLAEALAANGDLAEAIATLEQTVSDRVATISSNLAHEDADHPLTLQLKTRH